MRDTSELPTRLEKAEWIHEMYASGLVSQKAAQLLLDVWLKYHPEGME